MSKLTTLAGCCKRFISGKRPIRCNSNMVLEYKAIQHIEQNLISLKGSRIIEGASADYAIYECINKCLPIQIKCTASCGQNKSARQNYQFYRWSRTSGYQNMLLLFFAFVPKERLPLIWYTWSNDHSQNNTRIKLLHSTCKSLDNGRIHCLDSMLSGLYEQHPEYHVPFSSLNKRNGEDKDPRLMHGRIAEDWVFDWCVINGFHAERHSFVSGSKYDLVVEGKRVQVKSCFVRRRNGAYKLLIQDKHNSMISTYFQSDFDILALCLANDESMALKYIYWIPMGELVRLGIVASDSQKGKFAIYLYPQQDKGKFTELEQFRHDLQNAQSAL